MRLNPSEISDLIRARSPVWPMALKPHQRGTVVSVTDGIVRVHGLSEGYAGRNVWNSRITPSAWR